MWTVILPVVTEGLFRGTVITNTKQVVVSRKQCKIETWLLQTTNRKSYVLDQYRC